MKRLVAAQQALVVEDRRTALLALLDAWREVRHPRIADLIDFVSEQLGGERFPGKTLAAKLETWQAVAANRDPADLGRLLAHPWPGTWQKALPMLQALVRFDDDPRLAMHLARTVDATQYVTWSSSQFYIPLIRRLDELGDVRTLPLLRAQLGKDKPPFYARVMRRYEEASVEALEDAFPDGPPALDEPTGAALAAIEALYAEPIARRARKTRGDAEYLAAIHEHPDDLEARAVYADWLQEHGDPRGEFITLQLARLHGEPSAAAIARERKLLDEHGRAWAGGPDSFFERHDRIFEGGFLVGGRLRRVEDATFGDPAWSLVRVLIGDGWSTDALLEQLVATPALRSLRAVHGLTERTAARIASGALTGLAELGFIGEVSDPTEEHPLAHCRALPDLRVLAIVDLDDTLAAQLRDAPVFERIERLMIAPGAPVRSWLEPLARCDGALREIELVASRDGSLVREDGCHVRLSRSRAPDEFSTVHVHYRSSDRAPTSRFATELVTALACIPQRWPRTIVVDAGRKLMLDAEDRVRLAEALSRFTQLEQLDVPWDRVPSEAARAGVVLEVKLAGGGLLDPAKIAAVWDVLGELEPHYDAMHVGHGSALRPLGKDPVARLAKWAANPKIEEVMLVRDGHPERAGLGRSERLGATYVRCCVERSRDELVAWLVRLLALGTFEKGAIEPTGLGPFQLELRDLGVARPGWIMVLAPRASRVFPVDAVAALADRPPLAGLVAVEAPRNLVISPAPSLAELTQARFDALAAGLHEIAARRLRTIVGFDVAARLRDKLGPIAAELGLAFQHATSTRVAYGSPSGLQLEGWLDDPLGTPKLRAGMRSTGKRKVHWHLVRGDQPAIPREQAAELARAAAERAGIEWTATLLMH
ncbi:MAG TPA: TIGR02996 domain-containing protein [Kofleriaceae bacterium]|nr:TIGR02996 domain-containing protein [Kofleriaceae bacterium]